MGINKEREDKKKKKQREHNLETTLRSFRLWFDRRQSSEMCGTATTFCVKKKNMKGFIDSFCPCPSFQRVILTF